MIRLISISVSIPHPTPTSEKLMSDRRALRVRGRFDAFFSTSHARGTCLALLSGVSRLRNPEGPPHEILPDGLK
jgi:hypothetical protein